MLEEAAGTRMYESKRAAAQKTIEKKDSKLKEIDAVSVQKNFSTMQRFLAGQHGLVQLELCMCLQGSCLRDR